MFLWLATVFSSAGYWLQQVVVGWLAYEITGSAFWTSLALGLDALPILLAGPVGGVLVDSFDRRKLLAFIFGYQAIVTTVFAGIIMTGNLEAWHIFAFIFLMGMAWVVSDPARMSLIPNIVPKKNLVNAFALSSMAFSVTRLAAPALGGVLIAVAGPGPTLALEAALQICAIFVALCLRVTRADRPALRLPTVFSELREGVRYVRNDACPDRAVHSDRDARATGDALDSGTHAGLRRGGVPRGRKRTRIAAVRDWVRLDAGYVRPRLQGRHRREECRTARQYERPDIGDGGLFESTSSSTPLT